MPSPVVVVTLAACGTILRLVADQVVYPLRIGLFQNDWWPDTHDVITAVVPADFSGYAGLQAVGTWTAPIVAGDRAVMTAPRLTWTHSGGPVGNWIYGHYCVDATGALVLAQRRDQYPTGMRTAGQRYAVDPTLSMASRFLQ